MQPDRRLLVGDRTENDDASARASHHTGLLIIRAWAEPESPDPLRAQIRVAGDISIGIERTLTLVQIGAVTALVEAWLRGIVSG